MGKKKVSKKQRPKNPRIIRIYPNGKGHLTLWCVMADGKIQTRHFRPTMSNKGLCYIPSV